MNFTPDIEDAVAKFATERKVSREEAISLALRDWLVGNGYLAQSEDEEPVTAIGFVVGNG